MWNKGSRENDVEDGSTPLYPMMLENPELRWSFIRKVYSIVTFQFLCSIAVGYVAFMVRPISLFFATTTAGLVLYILLGVISLIALCMLSCYYKMHPVNYVLLGLFTVFFSLVLGLACSFSSGKIVLEAVILTTAVVLSLTLYTFWAARRGHDISFIWLFVFVSAVVLFVFAFIQIFFPFGRVGDMIYSCLSSIIYCAFIIYDTDNIIKRYSYDEYIMAAVSLYLDILGLFLSILRFFQDSKR